MGWKRKMDVSWVTTRALIATVVIAFLLISFISKGTMQIAEHLGGFLGAYSALAAMMATLTILGIIKPIQNSRKQALIIIGLNVGISSALIATFWPTAYSISTIISEPAFTNEIIAFGLYFSIVLALLQVLVLASIREIIGDRILGVVKHRFSKTVGHASAEKLRLALIRTKKVWEQYKQNRAGMFALSVLIVIGVIAVAGPIIAPEDPLASKVPESLTPQSPNWNHWFGTDSDDKDVWSQFLFGAGTSLIVGLLAGLISLIIGTAIGMIAGYFGRVWDEVLMRLTDFFLVIPWFPLMIVLVSILGRSLWVVILVIGIVSWSPTARVVRAAVLSIKEKQYIERSRALGAGNLHIIKRHIFPNVFPLIVATSILLVAEAIFSEAFLSFFGLGDPNVVSWGWMLERAHEKSAMLMFYWWWILPPSVGIILLIMSFYLVGDTLDEILNPRLKRR